MPLAARPRSGGLGGLGWRPRRPSGGLPGGPGGLWRPLAARAGGPWRPWRPWRPSGGPSTLPGKWSHCSVLDVRAAIKQSRAATTKHRVVSCQSHLSAMSSAQAVASNIVAFSAFRAWKLVAHGGEGRALAYVATDGFGRGDDPPLHDAELFLKVIENPVVTEGFGRAALHGVACQHLRHLPVPGRQPYRMSDGAAE
eukprot:gene14411-biopygen9602